MAANQRKISHFEKRFCSNSECLKEFTPKTYNGTYCSPECRKVITNKKILERYHTNRSNRTKKRLCATNGCTTILSIYNKEKICEKCKIERYILRLKSWGWDESKLREEF